MKRGGPLKRSDKQMKHGGLPSATKEQQAVFDKLADQVGCAVCLFHCRHPDGSRVENSEGQIHHMLSGGNRISHSHVIPLCTMHHTDGKPGNPSRHSIMGKYGKAEFEAKYGTEEELAMQCEEWINVFYFSDASEITFDADVSAETDDDLLFQESKADEPEASNSNGSSGNANMESVISDDADAAQTSPRFNSQVDIHFVHFRHRKADPDGISVKATIDGLVKAGLLLDDSAKEIKTISHEQEQIPRSQEERTQITITEVA